VTTEAIHKPGLRVVLDARPLQAPERNPTTAIYLDALLGAFAAEPRAGESFLFLLDTPGPDPSGRFPGLPFAGRRRLPPTRRLRAAALTLDPFLLRAASIGARLGPRGAGESGSVLHVTGGTVPIASGLPMVVTLLDLATWELPAVYQRTLAERFGQRLRARLLRDAERIIVASEATARATSRFLPFPRERIHVVPLAPIVTTEPGVDFAERLAALRDRLRLPERYLLFRGQYDARKDLGTLLRALVALAGGAPPPAAAEGPAVPWPPIVVLATSGETEALARLVEREAAWPLVHLVPRLDPADEGVLLAGARALVHPALVEGSALPAIEALAAGVPVIASSVGAIPEIVGKAGILVPPRDPRRLAAAMSAAWSDDKLHARLARAAAKSAQNAQNAQGAHGAKGLRRTWADVAAETREVYTLAAARHRA
jgi:glycosyltransferase involved in cell wall biosynthesis